MDFLYPNKKRAYKRRLIIGYFLVGITILTTGWLLAVVTNGFWFDRNTGQVVQNGLVFVDSHPVSSKIFINGEDRGNTNGRFVLAEGEYKFELKKDGYRTWTRSVTLGGGEIERLAYPFLFPTKLTAEDVKAFEAQPDLVSQSPDKHWVFMHSSSGPNDFFLLDTTKTTDNITKLTIPTKIMTKQDARRFSLAEWSSDNKHVLVRSELQGSATFFMLDRESPDNTVNMSDALGRNFTNIILRDKKFDQVYAYDGVTGSLQSANLKTKGLSVIAQKVGAFYSYGSDTLVYETSDGAAVGKVLVKIVKGDKTFDLRSLSVGPGYMFEMAEYDGKEYLVVGSSSESQVYIYINAISELRGAGKSDPKALLRITGGNRLSFSENARFIALQGRSAFAVYDAEAKRQYKYDTKLEVLDGAVAKWMDGHRLTLVVKGKLNVFDFDGVNKQELVNATEGYAPIFTSDYKALYTLSPSATVTGKIALSRTSLIVK